VQEGLLLDLFPAFGVLVDLAVSHFNSDVRLTTERNDTPSHPSRTNQHDQTLDSKPGRGPQVAAGGRKRLSKIWKGGQRFFPFFSNFGQHRPRPPSPSEP
jgi:hypothetical protein